MTSRFQRTIGDLGPTIQFLAKDFRRTARPAKDGNRIPIRRKIFRQTYRRQAAADNPSSAAFGRGSCLSAAINRRYSTFYCRQLLTSNGHTRIIKQVVHITITDYITTGHSSHHDLFEADKISSGHSHYPSSLTSYVLFTRTRTQTHDKNDELYI